MERNRDIKSIFMMEYKCTLSSACSYAKNHKLENVIKTEKDMPPLIVHYVDGWFELNDGNHRLEAYSNLGIQEYYVIVWITEKEE